MRNLKGWILDARVRIDTIRRSARDLNITADRLEDFLEALERPPRKPAAASGGVPPTAGSTDEQSPPETL